MFATATLLLVFLIGAPQTLPASGRRTVSVKRSIPRSKPVRSFDAAAVNDTQTQEAIGPSAAGSAVVRLQIRLDRAHFSPGEIDGHYGDNLRVALAGYQAAHQLQPTGIGDRDTWQSLNRDTAPALVQYTIAPDDVAGPFEPVPADIMAQAKLKVLGYESPQEELAERFHHSPKMLAQLNPSSDLTRAGEQILVPNLQRQFIVPAARD